MKIKKGDKVKVITGKYKGHVGVVLKAFPKKSVVVVEGVNLRKKAVNKKKFPHLMNIQESFIYVYHPIHVSNVKKIEDNNGVENINPATNEFENSNLDENKNRERENQ